jgi:exopolysaccharide production protein ExoQ
MNMPLLPFLICAIGTAGLFYLDRDRSARTSRALWLPVIWVSIVGSRPISSWLGVGPAGGNLDATLEGNSTDAAVFLVLLLAGVRVLIRRKESMRGFFGTNRPLVVYFTYCLLSVLWSPIPEPSFKRWIKAVGDVVMVLIVATDDLPVVAIGRFFSYVGFLLLPASVLLIRYSDLGRGFDPDGNAMNTGVTTNKNMLGVLVLVVGLAALWHVCALLRAKRQPDHKSRLVAQCTLLAFSIALLAMAHSATCVGCFVLGSGLILVSSLPMIQRRPGLIHIVVLTLVLGGGLGMVFGGDAVVVGALGRDTSLTGRTDIWTRAISLARDPIIGSGFESFWNSNSQILRTFSEVNMFSNLNSAHNGYIEVYLELGWVGLGLIVTILMSSYRLAGRVFQCDPEIGGLILAYVMTIPLYNISEAGFRLFSPIWISFLLSYVFAGRILRGYAQNSEVSSEPIDQAVPLGGPDRNEVLLNGAPETSQVNRPQHGWTEA